MAFQAPHTGQEKQNRKILEQLEEQKKLLRMAAQAPHGGRGTSGTSGTSGAGAIVGNSANLTPSTPPPMIAGIVTSGGAPMLSSPIIGGHGLGGGDQQHMTHQQRAALQHAHANSVGYFITQDSSFGNLILPVLPRFDAKS